MPRRSLGPRLYLDRARDQWVIRDGARFVRTGCSRHENQRADLTLAAYIAQKYEPKASRSPLIEEMLLAYARDVVPNLATKRNKAYNIKSLKSWWSGKKLSDITARECRAYAATKTPSAAGADLKVLQAAVRHWHEEYGPLPSIPKVWRPKENPARERWLTKNEAARLLRAARPWPYLARMILIGLHTGSRPGVSKALQWDWIDFDRGIMRRRAPGTSDRGNKRSPPVKLGRKILLHLRRWHRTANGIKWVVNFNGRQIGDPHASWKWAVTAAQLPGTVTPHTLRHTRATWLMQAGVDPWEAAGHLGMSLRVLESVYGHHHPNWQSGAADI